MDERKNFDEKYRRVIEILEKKYNFNKVLENSRFGYGVLERNKNTPMSSSKVKKVSLKVKNQIDKSKKKTVWKFWC